MNINYNYLTTVFGSILIQIYVFLVLCTIFHFDIEKFISKNLQIYNFLHVHLGENTSKYCSRIYVVQGHATFFLSLPSMSQYYKL